MDSKMIEKELNVGKSCKNCETHYQNEHGNVNPNTPCEADDDEYSIGFCKHWTPKADKVEV